MFDILGIYKSTSSILRFGYTQHIVMKLCGTTRNNKCLLCCSIGNVIIQSFNGNRNEEKKS